MNALQSIKNAFKHILPPPTRSFMREIDNLKSHLLTLQEENKAVIAELAFMREENARQLAELNEIHEWNKKQAESLESVREWNKKQAENLESVREWNKKQAENLESIREECKVQASSLNNDLSNKIQKVYEQTRLNTYKTSEAVWAEVFNNTITGSTWLKDQAFSPGRWALGYGALYVMYRILNGIKPKSILELGLGQSTNMITQYAASDLGVEHFVVEHDPAWIAFYKEEYPLSKQTEIIQLERDFVPFKEADAVRVFKGFKEVFISKKFDFIVIDAPLGGDMKQYSRIDILGLLPDCLCESFAILFDDTERPGEIHTIQEILTKLRSSGIDCVKGDYCGEKNCTVICSKNNEFLRSL